MPNTPSHSLELDRFEPSLYPAQLSFYDRLGIFGQDYTLGLVPSTLGNDPGIADLAG